MDRCVFCSTESVLCSGTEHTVDSSNGGARERERESLQCGWRPCAPGRLAWTREQASTEVLQKSTMLNFSLNQPAGRSLCTDWSAADSGDLHYSTLCESGGCCSGRLLLAPHTQCTGIHTVSLPSVRVCTVQAAFRSPYRVCTIASV